MLTTFSSRRLIGIFLGTRASVYLVSSMNIEVTPGDDGVWVLDLEMGLEGLLIHGINGGLVLPRHPVFCVR